MIKITLPKTRILVGLSALAFYALVATVILFWGQGFRVSYLEKGLIRTGLINISTVPEEASVYVDSVLQEEKTPLEIKLRGGKTYQIVAKKDGYKDWESEIFVREGFVTVLVDIRLVPKNLSAQLVATEVQAFYLAHKQGILLYIKKQSDLLEVLDLEKLELKKELKLPFMAQSFELRDDTYLKILGSKAESLLDLNKLELLDATEDLLMVDNRPVHPNSQLVTLDQDGTLTLFEQDEVVLQTHYVKDFRFEGSTLSWRTGNEVWEYKDGNATLKGRFLFEIENYELFEQLLFVLSQADELSICDIYSQNCYLLDTGVSLFALNSKNLYYLQGDKLKSLPVLTDKQSWLSMLGM